MSNRKSTEQERSAVSDENDIVEYAVQTAHAARDNGWPKRQSELAAPAGSTITVQDLKKILAMVPNKSPLFFGPSLIPLAGVIYDTQTKQFYLYSSNKYSATNG